MTEENQPQNAIQIRQEKEKQIILDQLKKIPIIQIAAEKSGVGRASLYRWRKEDKKFDQQIKEAMTEGVAYINDLSESELISLIRQGKFPAVQLWLKVHHPKYANKLEITTKEVDEKMSPEEQTMAINALKFFGVAPDTKTNESEDNKLKNKKDNDNPKQSGA